MKNELSVTNQTDILVTADGNRVVKQDNPLEMKVEYGVLKLMNDKEVVLSYEFFNRIKSSLRDPDTKFVYLPDGSFLATHQIVGGEYRQKKVPTHEYSEGIRKMYKEITGSELPQGE